MENIFRFASFEADRDRHLLRDGSRRLKVERIPLDLLFLLLEQHGKLVTRERIVSRLWGTEVYLDTERSINTAIRKIRKALSDDPRHPLFIETVVGKGYRFVAPVIQQQRTTAPDSGPTLKSGQHSNFNSGRDYDVRLYDFQVGPSDGGPTLTCKIATNGTPLGRVSLAELEIPAGMTLPLKPEDKLLMNLLSLGVRLTSKGAESLKALCITLLQNGVPTEFGGFELGEDIADQQPSTNGCQRSEQREPCQKASSAG